MPPPAASPRGRPLSLALSGGGVKCAAQAGVLAVLDEAGLPVGALAGASGGGLVAILYALGYSPREILENFANLHLWEMWELDPDRRAIFGGAKIRARIRSLVGNKTFADLKMPVTAVAADLATQREVDISSGSLADAMAATMAFPVVFPPVVHGSAVLVDGAAINPLPVDVARCQGPRVVAVDVMHDSRHHTTHQLFEGRGPMRYVDEAVRRLGLTAMFDGGYASLGLMGLQLAELNLRLHPPDVLLQPAVGSVGLFAFDLAYQAYQAGEAVACAALPELEALSRPTLGSRVTSLWRRLRQRR